MTKISSKLSPRLLIPPSKAKTNISHALVAIILSLPIPTFYPYHPPLRIPTIILYVSFIIRKIVKNVNGTNCFLTSICNTLHVKTFMLLLARWSGFLIWACHIMSRPDSPILMSTIPIMDLKMFTYEIVPNFYYSHWLQQSLPSTQIV